MPVKQTARFRLPLGAAGTLGATGPLSHPIHKSLCRAQKNKKLTHGWTKPAVNKINPTGRCLGAWTQDVSIPFKEKHIPVTVRLSWSEKNYHGATERPPTEVTIEVIPTLPKGVMLAHVWSTACDFLHWPLMMTVDNTLRWSRTADFRERGAPGDPAVYMNHEKINNLKREILAFVTSVNTYARSAHAYVPPWR